MTVFAYCNCGYCKPLHSKKNHHWAVLENIHSSLSPHWRDWSFRGGGGLEDQQIEWNAWGLIGISKGVGCLPSGRFGYFLELHICIEFTCKVIFHLQCRLNKCSSVYSWVARITNSCQCSKSVVKNTVRGERVNLHFYCLDCMHL